MVRRWKTELPVDVKRDYFIATMLDPRQKELRFPGVSKGDRHLAQDWFAAEFKSLWDKPPSWARPVVDAPAPAPAPTPEPAPEPAPVTAAPAPAPVHAGRPTWAGILGADGMLPVTTAPATTTSARKPAGSFLDFMDGLAHLQDDNTEPASPAPVKSEAERYLDMEPLPMRTDILVWWATVGEREYPRLSVMARQYLGCPATSASAERLFSIAGRVYDDLRQGMDECMLELLMWARINRQGRTDSRTTEGPTVKVEA